MEFSEFGLVTVTALGFVLGMRHALDADHVVAVSMIVSREKSLFRSMIVGGFWGIGHTATLLAVGAAILLLKVTIPDSVALAMELAVGIMLVFLGGMVAANLVKERFHLHPHHHEGPEESTHLHIHVHENHEPHPHSHQIPGRYRALAVGMVHGLAGGAALMLLVLSNIQSAGQGLLYISVFGLGSILGMMLVSLLVGIPLILTSVRFSGLNKTLTAFASLASIVLGTLIIYEIGFVRGLFL